MLGEGVGDDDDTRLVELDDVLAVRLGCFRVLSVGEPTELLELSIKFRRGRLEAERSDSSLALPVSESEKRSDELAWLWEEDPDAAFLRLDLDPSAPETSFGFKKKEGWQHVVHLNAASFFIIRIQILKLDSTLAANNF